MTEPKLEIYTKNPDQIAAVHYTGDNALEIIARFGRGDLAVANDGAGPILVLILRGEADPMRVASDSYLVFSVKHGADLRVVAGRIWRSQHTRIGYAGEHGDLVKEQDHE